MSEPDAKLLRAIEETPQKVPPVPWSPLRRLRSAAIVVVVVLMTATAAWAGIATWRESSRRAKCAKQVNQFAVAQMNFATSQNKRGTPDAFVRGVEYFNGPRPSGYSGPAEYTPNREGGKYIHEGTDASRVFVYLLKQNFIDSAGQFACPGDPFVAPLDIAGSDLDGNRDTDLHAAGMTEGKALGRDSRWCKPENPAATQDGFTYFSYSMQAGSAIVSATPGPKMSRQMPFFGERNPWCPGYTAANGGESPTAKSAVGNPWSHNRAGASVAFVDGSTTFVTDSQVELPPDAQTGTAGGNVYLYADRAPVPGAADRAGKCVPPGGVARTTTYTAWMAD